MKVAKETAGGRVRVYRYEAAVLLDSIWEPFTHVLVAVHQPQIPPSPPTPPPLPFGRSLFISVALGDSQEIGDKFNSPLR